MSELRFEIPDLRFQMPEDPEVFCYVSGSRCYLAAITLGLDCGLILPVTHSMLDAQISIMDAGFSILNYSTVTLLARFRG